MNRHYLLIGNGRLASHLKHYLSLLGVDVTQWARRTHCTDSLDTLIHRTNTTLLAITDSAIEPFLKEHPALLSHCRIHFSGTLSTSLAWGVHPLMTFSHNLYTLEEYRRFPFVLEEGAPDLRELFPLFSNPQFRIRATEKPLYHALAVMASNFTYTLTERCAREFSKRWGIDQDSLAPILETSVSNALRAGCENKNLLTGPFSRGDRNTVSAHLTALQNNELRPLYQEFARFLINRRNDGHPEMEKELET